MAISKQRNFYQVNCLPSSPSKVELLRKEQRFTLDCVAVDNISKDYCRTSPKLGSAIPPYDAQRDPHATSYFSSKPVLPLLRRRGWVVYIQFLQLFLSLPISLKNPVDVLDALLNLHPSLHQWHFKKFFMKQVNRRASSYEQLVERFQHRSDAALYLLSRNKAGAGHSIAQVRGHQLYLSSVKPVLGYNGAYGYRRNTPSLRKRPSSFGILTMLPIY